jgi:hypothetical protein
MAANAAIVKTNSRYGAYKFMTLLSVSKKSEILSIGLVNRINVSIKSGNGD